MNKKEYLEAQRELRRDRVKAIEDFIQTLVFVCLIIGVSFAYYYGFFRPEAIEHISALWWACGAGTTIILRDILNYKEVTKCQKKK